MSRDIHPHERQLMSLLLGELPPDVTRRLEERLAADGTLRARYEGLRAGWDDLELEPVSAPADFRERVIAAARTTDNGTLSWGLAPPWARAGSVAALVLGLVLGLGFGRPAEHTVATTLTRETAAELDAFLAAELADELPSLAEIYWSELESVLDGEAP